MNEYRSPEMRTLPEAIPQRERAEKVLQRQVPVDRGMAKAVPAARIGLRVLRQAIHFEGTGDRIDGNQILFPRMQAGLQPSAADRVCGMSPAVPDQAELEDLLQREVPATASGPTPANRATCRKAGC